MQLSFTLLILGLALVSSAVSDSANANALTKRTVDNLPPSDQFIACPGYRYSRAQVENATQQGINLTPTVEPQPGLRLPSHLRNKYRLPFAPICNGRTLYEFPLLHGGSIYGSGGPGADRVVFFIYTDNPDTNPTQDGSYCGVMTHDGAPAGEFALCPVED